MSEIGQRLTNLSVEKRRLLRRHLRQEAEKARAAPGSGRSPKTEENRIAPRHPESAAPLSFGQQRLWFLDQLEPGSTVYNLGIALRLSGLLELPVLRAALGQIVRRHELLRTTFTMDLTGGEPVQRVAPEAPHDLPLVDLGRLPTAAGQGAAQRWAEAVMSLPYDLSRGPLVRFLALRLDEDSHVLVVALHHIVSDAWSFAIMMREVSVLYQAFAAGRRSPLPPLPIQYADFAVWQRRWLADEVLERELAYWRRQLAGMPRILQLPTDRPRPAVPSGLGGQVPVTIAPELVQRLEAFGRRHNATLFMTLLAAFDTLLCRHTGQEDVVVGSAIAGRNRAQLEGLVGFFVNTVVLRGDLAGDPGFREVLERIRAIALSAYAHQDLPFEKLVEELQPERDLSVTPLFQVMFDLTDAQFQISFPAPSAVAGSGLAIERLPSRRRAAMFDLTLAVARSADDGLGGFLEYSADLFDRTTPQRMARHLTGLLASLTDQPELAISAVALLTEAERQQLFVEWNDRETSAADGEACLDRLFAERAAEFPESVATVCGSRCLTYRELDERADRWAWWLGSHGVAPDVLVALLAERGCDLLTAILGVLKAGGAYLPLDPAHPPARQRQILRQSAAALVLAEGRFFPELGRALKKWPEQACPRLVELDRLPPRGGSPLDRPQRRDPATLAYVIFTSGSTGTAKGAMVVHRGMLNHLRAKISDLALSRVDVVAETASQCFDISVWQFLTVLLLGGRVEIAVDEIAHDPERLLEFAAERRLTILEVVPSMLRGILETLSPSAGGPDLSTLRWLLVTGEAFPVELERRWLRRFPNVPLLNAYGPTECSDDVTHHAVHRHRPETARNPQVPIGRPLVNFRIHVLNRRLRPVPLGATGELGVVGRGVGRGYLDAPGKTAEVFVPDPLGPETGGRLYRTGDLARALSDGRLEFLGRIDHQVKVRGFRVELGEIESVLRSHPAVEESVLVARSDADDGGASGAQHLVAYVVPAAGAQADGGEGNGEMVDGWRSVFDDAYSRRQLARGDSAAHLSVWVSSYTSQSMPEEEIFECVEDSARRILALRPRRVLEIGCGTGLVLCRVAPSCERYWGTDISKVAIDALRSRVADRAPELGEVRLLERAANDFSGIPHRDFDIVVINEVVQYLPGIDYLAEVLEGALRALVPGGAIFVGGVRSLPLMEVFHSSVQLAKAPPGLPTTELRQRVAEVMAREKELLVDPQFFAAFARRVPGIGSVGIQLKGGRAENELTKFRYDVVLRLGGARRRTTPRWLDWRRDELSLPALRRILSEEKSQRIGLRSVPNARLLAEVRALELLAGDDGPATVDELRIAVRESVADAGGIEPDDFWALERDLGLSVAIHWNGADRATYDVLIEPGGNSDTDGAAMSLDGSGNDDSETWSRWANTPLKAGSPNGLVPQLRAFLGESLPGYMVPSAFVFLERFPLTPNGKLDRRALPAPELGAETRGDFVAARNPTEELLAGFFAEILRADRVGVEDNFFDLGGHSLLATRLMARMRDTFGVEVSLRTLFENPTVAGLARHVAEAPAESPEASRPPPIEPLPRRGPMALSFSQRRLWFLHQMQPESAAYNIPAALVVEGALDVAAFGAAFDEVLRRHEVLRTTFDAIDGEPVQIVAPPERLRLSVVDLSGLPAAVGEGESRRLARQEAHRPFDLTRGPLLRAGLLALGPKKYAVLVTMHHIVADGWSMDILVREVAGIYVAFRQAGPSPFEELPVQYADFASWQRRWLRGEVLEEKLAFWRRLLGGGDLPVLDLPTDFPRPAVQSFRGARESLRVPRVLTQDLRELGRRAGATLFMTLASAFTLLLHRLTGQDDILLGMPEAGRDRAETEGLIGCFLNTLVLRTDLSGRPTFLELLGRVRQVALGVHAHREVPFEHLLQELQPRRDLSRTPIFQVLFNMLNVPETEVELPDLTVRALTPFLIESKFDLTVYAAERGQQIQLTLVYNADLFAAERIRQLLDQLDRILTQVVERPEQHIDQYSLVTPSTRGLVGDPAEAIEEPAFESLAHRIRRQARGLADHTVVRCGERFWSFAELEARACQAAGFLARHGVRPGGVVAVSGPRCPELISVVLAVTFAGGAFLILDPKLPAARRRVMLREAQAGWLIPIGASPSDWARGMPALRILDHGMESPRELPADLPELGPDEPVYVFFTSGTSGVPKAVLGRHKGLCHFLAWQRKSFEIDVLDRVANLTGLSFDVVLREIFLALTSGAALCLPSEDERGPSSVLPWLESRAVTVLHTVPSLAGVWLEHPTTETCLGSLRWIFFAGEPLLDRTVRLWRTKFPSAGGIVNLYGPTETTLARCFHRVADPPDPGVQPVGAPLPQTDVFVMTAGGRLCGVGEPGELVIRTPFRSLGYLNARDGEGAFRPNPWSESANDLLYFTGDRGRRRPDGVLEILGRLDDQLKIRGMRVEPAEIRAVLGELDGVRACAVLLREEAAGNPILVAYVVASEDGLDLTEARQALRRKLPDYMVPSAFVPLAALPLTPNGKLDRAALPAPKLAPAAPAGSRELLNGPVEELLATLWSEVLGVDGVGPGDNFFDLGGHSLLAMRLLSRVREAFGVELAVRQVFEHPYCAALADRIVKERRAGRSFPAGVVETLPRTAGGVPLAPPVLSFSQQRLWFLHQLEPESAAYNIPRAARLEGALDVAAISACIGEIVRRHETLRTTFAAMEGKPVQVIASPLDKGVWNLPVVDLRALSETGRRREARRLRSAEALRPFDLARGPLLRVSLLVQGPAEFALLLTMHHVVSDLWSMEVLLREIKALYSALTSGNASPLPELGIQYADFADWQRRWLSGDLLETELGYWRDRLHDLPRALELPTDRPRPAHQTFAGENVPFRLRESVVAGLRKLSRNESSTLFMTLLSVFDLLLYRWSGQDRIGVGTPIAGRHHRQTEELIGFFVNTLVLHTRLAPDESFLDLLRRVRESTLTDFEHQDLPFERLVEELQPVRDLGRSPLFQVMFALQALSGETLALPGIDVRAWGEESVTAKFDLSLHVAVGEARLAALLNANAELFDRSTLDRMARHFDRLAQAVLDDPACPLSALPLLTRAEIQQTQLEWNDTSRPADGQGGCLHHGFEEFASRTPDAMALVNARKWLTYGELDFRADRLAHRLGGRGLLPESRVGILLPRTQEMVVAMIAVLKAGGAFVALDPAYPENRLRFMVEDAAMSLLLTVGSSASTLIAGGVEVLDLDRAPGDIAVESGRDADSAADPRQLAYLIYTSGSTGRPKGVAIEHRSAAELVRWARGAFSDHELGGVLASTSICFDLSIFEIFAPLSWGGKLVLAENALELPGLAAAEEVRLVNTVPSAWAGLMSEGWPASLETVNLAGEPLTRALLEEIYRRPSIERVCNLYGPSEDSTYSTWVELTRQARQVTIGRPLTNSRAYVVDRQGRQAPLGVVGELHLAGDGLARGYLDRPAATAEKFAPHPFSERPGERCYHTGDRARLLARGEIDFLGRIDQQVKLRGFRIEMGEIEAILKAQPEVREGVVLLRRDVPGGGSLVAYFVSRQGVETAHLAHDLEACLKRELPGYSVPAFFVPLARLPRLPNGKVDRGALPAPLQDRHSEAAPDAPLDPVEGILVEIWRDVLGIDKISRDASFFKLGGHSLLATQVLSRVRAHLGAELPLRALFEDPTVSALARQVEAKRGGGASVPPIRPIGHRDRLPLSYAQERLWFLHLLEPESSVYNISTAVRLEGELAVAAMVAAVDEIVRRHEALRTTFELEDGRPLQRIQPVTGQVLKVVDLKGLSAEASGIEARRITAEMAARPFDLARGHLVRAVLVHLAPQDHLGIVNMHHVASDAWSVGIFIGELAALYEAFAHGTPSPLPELSIQYADFAAWQRTWLSDEVMEEQSCFWRQRFAVLPEPLELPADRPRPPVRRYRGGVVSALLPDRQLSELKNLGQQRGATLFMTVLATLDVFLHRLTGRREAVVGTPVAGRHLVEIERLVGCFINTLALKVEVTGELSFSMLLDNVREVTLEAFAHQYLPFEKLVEELKPERHLGQTPIFQVQLVALNTPLRPLELPGLTLRPVPSGAAQSKFDLNLTMAETITGLRFSLTYNVDLFDAVTALRFSKSLGALLRAVAADPDREISGLSLLGPAEEHQLLRSWNDSSRAFPYGGRLVHELVEQQVRRRPEAVAAVFEGHELTYGELDGHADRLARRLRHAGVGPEVFVAIAMERCLEMVVGMLGILKAGGAYVPIDVRFPRDRQRFILEDSRTPVVLVRGSRPLFDPGVLTGSESLHDVETIRLGADGESVDAGPGWEESAVGPRPTAANAAYAIFTSGSTGRPKGVVVEHRQVLNYVDGLADRLPGLAGASFALVQPLAVDSSVSAIFPPLVTGGTLHLVSEIAATDPEALASELSGHVIAGLKIAPSHLGALQAVGPEPAALLPRRWVVIGGEASRPDWMASVVDQAGSCAVHHHYGPTEATVGMLTCRLDRGRPIPGAQLAAVALGRPMSNTRAHVVDRHLRAAPVGAPGELAVGGLCLARGYLRRAALSAARFVPDSLGERCGARLYLTGDRVRFLGDGNLVFLGRFDDQVKIRGFRIELGEIRVALARHPRVREAVVMIRDEQLVGYVVADGAFPRSEQLRSFLKNRLPDYMVPSVFVPVESLPRTAHGKLDLSALPEPREPTTDSVLSAPPRTGTEEAIAKMWRDVLGLERIGAQDNFFDLGGHSLLLIQLHARLRESGHRIAMIDLFRYPTVRTLADFLDAGATGAQPPVVLTSKTARGRESRQRDSAVAVIGMACRFPGAEDVGELWRNLCGGVESVTFFSAEELIERGLGPAQLEDPRYVRARGVLSGADLFDADFFGYSPREAQVMDPQQRVFLECAWTALEDAGYDPPRYSDRIGVFAGSSHNTYLYHLISNPGLVRVLGAMQVSLGNKNDYLPTRVSYKLNLSGPAVNVQTACSTSLVAIHLACQSLRTGECEMALAGGVSVNAQFRQGYLHEEGGIMSADGHTRTFDARAEGTAPGDGVGIVVLKSLADAQADGDTIRAVIRGSAINNDGSRKVGFTAPSIEGQAKAIAEAQQMAGIGAESVGYVETHGTATALGDPIELAALTEAFRASTEKKGFCGLGSIKSNFGHLDAAAGVAGFIKAVLALENRQLPPSLHYEEPNPKFDFADSAFYVNASLKPWSSSGEPRRAGVSSFGLGGTNAHVVLEEAPRIGDSRPARPYQILVLSAKTRKALDTMTANLANHLQERPELDLADAAYTLQVGRQRLPFRRMVVCREHRDALEALRDSQGDRVLSVYQPAEQRPAVFLFPGGGAQYPRMGYDLYRSELVYRREIERAAEVLARRDDVDLKSFLYAEDGSHGEAARRLRRTSLALPALFATEYALAKLWMSWGVEPEALIGHSLGEYVAACLAGVISFEDALAMVTLRGHLFEEIPKGGMLSVSLPYEEVEPLLGDELSFAAINTDSSCVASGPMAAIGELERKLAAQGVESTRLHIDVAAHSKMLEPILGPFADFVSGLELNPPGIPYISNVTGTWITPEEATDPGYWPRHLRHTVRFASGLEELFRGKERILLEVGPGRTLSTLAHQHSSKPETITVVSSMRDSRQSTSDLELICESLGRIWAFGSALDWSRLYRSGNAAEPRRRIPLPTYPFERRRFWVEPQRLQASAEGVQEELPPLEEEPQREEVIAEAEILRQQVAPRSELERRVHQLWRDYLGVDHLGIHDNFFDLGGSSMLAVRLSNAVGDAVASQISPNVLIEAPTVARLAEWISGRTKVDFDEPEAAPRMPPCLSLMVAGDESRPPLFLIHAIGGTLFRFMPLAREIGPLQPIYGIRSLGLEAGETPFGRIEEMSAHYIEAMKHVQPRGPYYLIGSSMGGTVVYEMARQLVHNGDRVAMAAMLDTSGPEYRPVEDSNDELQVMAYAVSGRIRMQMNELRAMDRETRLNHVLEGMKKEGQLPDDFGIEQASRHLHVLKVNIDALDLYEAQPYPGRILYFRARERRQQDPPNPENFWYRLSQGGLLVHEVPGTHVSIYLPPHHATLAQKVREYMSEVK